MILDRLFSEVVLEYSYLGLLYLSRADVSNVVYCIALWPKYTPKMVLVSLSEYNGKELAAISITLPTGW